MSYAIALLLVGLVILAHEWGHFIAARASGIAVSAFSIGFGPTLRRFTWRGTEFRLSLIPLGGYVLPAVASEEDYFRIPASRRIVLSAGGLIASALFPIPCLMIAALFKPDPSLHTLLIEPFIRTAVVFSKTIASLPAVFRHGEGLSGVIGIVAQGGHFLSTNPANAAYFAAVLSVNFAVLNLLPVPALDGGKILLFSLERISPGLVRLHYPLAIAGWVFILGVFVYTIVIDLSRYAPSLRI